MIQTTTTDDGLTVTVDTNNAPPKTIITQGDARITLTAMNQDGIYAIRSALSRMLDAMKGGRVPEQKP